MKLINMKKLPILFTLIFSLSFFSSKSNAEWTNVGRNSTGNTHYIDFENIRKHNGYVYYWILSDYLKPLTPGKLLSSKRYQQGDCNIFRFKVLSYVYHKQPMGRDIGKSAEPVNKKWRYPSPSDGDASDLKLVCKYVRGK